MTLLTISEILNKSRLTIREIINKSHNAVVSKDEDLIEADAKVAPVTCFVKNTPVLTDQGIIPIQKIIARKNTINGQKIRAISKSINRHTPMITIEKYSLGKTPICKIEVTHNHLILFNDSWIQAGNLCHLDGISSHNIHNVIVYNVLLDKHSTMNVAGLTVETLNPKVLSVYTNKKSMIFPKTVKHKNHKIINK